MVEVMTVEEIIEFSQKLYEQVANSGMNPTEALICADALKNSLLFNDFMISQEKIKNEYRHDRSEN